MTENMGAPSVGDWRGRSDGGDAVDFDVEAAVPGGNTDEDPRRPVLREILAVDLVDVGEEIDRRAVDVAFEDIVQRRAGRLEHQLNLLQDRLGLCLDRSRPLDDLAVLVERGAAGEIKRVAVADDGAGGRLVLLEQGGDRLDANDLSLHRI